MHFWLLSLLFGLAGALRCYDGTVDLDSNLRTKEKDCGISEYCIQKINKSTKKITRECSSFTDDHNMEEKCPMSGCHWQSSTETYCCCQFDLCNEYKADGSPFHEKEMKKAGETEKPKSTPSSRVSIKEDKLRATESPRKTTSSSRKTDEIELED